MVVMGPVLGRISDANMKPQEVDVAYVRMQLLASAGQPIDVGGLMMCAGEGEDGRDSDGEAVVDHEPVSVTIPGSKSITNRALLL